MIVGENRALRFTFLGALCILALCSAAAASPLTPRENIPVNSEVFVQPEYIEALDKELEREGLAALQAQEDSGHLRRSEQSNSNGPGYAHNQKFASQRKLELAKVGPAGAADRFSERVVYPAEMLGLNGKKNLNEIDRSGYSSPDKRNFDEIDRFGFSGFNKRNLDEIDRSGFSGFNKRNFDEIDRNGFSGFSKRNFDEIDRSGFSGFSKRNLYKIGPSRGFSPYERKRNFDEIDRSGFSGFSKRNFDEIDRSGVPGFTKRSVSKQNKLAGRIASRRRR